MYPPGHVGVTIILFAPLLYVLFAVGKERKALGWLALAVALSLAPDLDALVPVFAHRGTTHTLLAAMVLGIAVAGVGWMTHPSSTRTRMEGTALGFLIGAGAVVSHLLGDIITPMGVRLFFPLRDTVYSLDVVRASNPRANTLLLLAGIVSLAISYGTGTRQFKAHSSEERYAGRDRTSTDVTLETVVGDGRGATVSTIRSRTEADHNPGGHTTSGEKGG